MHPTVSDIYPSSLTNVRFKIKIEFWNVVKCRLGSQGDISFTTGSWRNTGGGSEGKKCVLFASGGQINTLK